MKVISRFYISISRY